MHTQHQQPESWSPRKRAQSAITSSCSALIGDKHGLYHNMRDRSGVQRHTTSDICSIGVLKPFSRA
jgi:hypothetical protein